MSGIIDAHSHVWTSDRRAYPRVSGGPDLPTDDFPPEKILALAQQLDFKEHSMYAIIEKARSIMEGVRQLGRL